jgi:hypothetical protein
MKALSIQQPWAGLVAAGLKDIENRTWSTRYRGPVLVHAGKKVDDIAMLDIKVGLHPAKGVRADLAISDSFPTGGIIGICDIVDCVVRHDSDWFQGPYGFVIANARAIPFQPCKGMLGFFTPGADWTPPDYLDGLGPMSDAERTGA